MIKKIFFFVIAPLMLVTIYTCSKKLDAIDNLKKSCLYDSKQDYFKKWSNTFTEIDTYNTAGTSVVSRSYIYPIGYFQLSANSSYNVLSDGVPLTGTWDVNDSCKLVLDAGTGLERKFDVSLLSKDSLVLKRKDGNLLYTQHYVAFNCPDLTLLETQWDNVSIVTETFDQTGITGRSVDYPVGYFTLNANNTYHVVSNGDDRGGSWAINDACQLLLDGNTPNQRAFDVQKLTADSLIIWRKQLNTGVAAGTGVNLLQIYVKHH